DREHERLVAVVAGPPVPGTEGLRHRELCDLLAFAGDAKRRVTDEHLAAGKLARRAAAHGEAVVGDDLFDADPELRVRGGDRDVGAGARLHPPSMLPAVGSRRPAAPASARCWSAETARRATGILSARSRNGSAASRNSSGHSAITRCPQRSTIRTSASGSK